ncbi:MAG: hypothetical protein Sapg2KO_44000 [Saprospiraceae bacterium]
MTPHPFRTNAWFQPTSVFSFSIIGLLLLLGSFGKILTDPPAVWIEKANRERIEEDTKSLQLQVMLSEVSDQEVTVRLNYTGDATRNRDFQAPETVTVSAGETEVQVTIQLRPTFYTNKELVVSILSASNAEVRPDPQKFFINRELIRQSQDGPQLSLRTPQGNVKLGTYIDVTNSSGDLQGTYIGDSTAHRISSGDYNTLLGFAAGRSLTSGSRNTLLGFKAGESNTTSELHAFGYLAGNSNTTGFDNTFMGYEAGRMTINGGDNTFIGAESGESNTTGYDNTFVGEESGANNTTGYENTFIGEDAGLSNTTGWKQTFIGNEVGISSDVGYRNTGVGSESMSDVDDGHHNTAVGDSSGIDVGDGTYNTFLGAASGVATEWAHFNTFIGAQAGWDNNRTNNRTNANANTYVGYSTGFSNREGEYNVGMGAFSDFNSTVRQRTTFIGADQSVDANDVIMMGYKAHSTRVNSINIGIEGFIGSIGAIGIGHQVNIPGSSNYSIAVGYNSTVSGTNSIAIGNTASVPADNEAYIGNATTASIGGVVNWTATSDERFKTNVQTNVPGLAFIDALRPVTYQMDVEAIFARQGRAIPDHLEEAAKAKEKLRYTGFLAQEVAKAALNLEYDFSGVDLPQNEQDAYGLRYAEFVVPLVKAVQELHQQLKDKDQLISNQKAELDQYKALLLNLNARVEALEAKKSADSEKSPYSGERRQ